jgi:hypothetical protein
MARFDIAAKSLLNITHASLRRKCKVRFVAMTALVVMLVLIGCGKDKKGQSMFNLRARQIKLHELQTVLHELTEKKLEFDFFGITSNGVDCVYFVPVDGKMDLEFEAMSQEQIPFIEILKKYAAGKGFTVLDTTYGNQPHYESTSSAPVLRIETKATTEDIAAIGANLMKDVFKCGDSTVFEIVP